MGVAQVVASDASRDRVLSPAAAHHIEAELILEEVVDNEWRDDAHDRPEDDASLGLDVEEEGEVALRFTRGGRSMPSSQERTRREDG